MGGRTAVCAMHGVDPCCVHPKGRALPNACVQSAVPIVNKEGIRRFLFNDFMNLSLPLILLAAFFSLSPPICLPAPAHSVALILALDKVVSMQFSQVPIFAFCSPGQSVVFGCVGGIIPFLISS